MRREAAWIRKGKDTSRLPGVTGLLLQKGHGLSPFFNHPLLASLVAFQRNQLEAAMTVIHSCITYKLLLLGYAWHLIDTKLSSIVLKQIQAKYQ